MALFNTFFYAPALLYIADKQPRAGVKRATEIFAIVTLLYSATKLRYNFNRQYLTGKKEK